MGIMISSVIGNQFFLCSCLLVILIIRYNQVSYFLCVAYVASSLPRKKKSSWKNRKGSTVTKFAAFGLENLALYLVPASLAFGLLSHIAADCSRTEIRSLL